MLPLFVREKFFEDMFNTYPDSNYRLMQILFRIRQKLLFSSAPIQNLKSELDELCVEFHEQFDNNIQQDMREFYMLILRYLGAELNLATGDVQLAPIGDFKIDETLDAYAHRCITNHWEKYETSILTQNKRFYHIERYECQNCIHNKCDKDCGCKQYRLQIDTQNFLQLDCQNDENSGIFVSFLNDLGIVQRTCSHPFIDFAIVVENNWESMCKNILQSNDSPYTEWTYANINQDIVHLTLNTTDVTQDKYLKIYVIETKRLPHVHDYPCICHIKSAHSIEEFPTLNALCSETGNMVCFQECPSPQWYAVPIAISVAKREYSEVDVPKHPLCIPYYSFTKSSNYYTFTTNVRQHLEKICKIADFNALACVFYLRVDVSDGDFTNMSKWNILWKMQTHEQQHQLFHHLQQKPASEIVILTRDQWSPYDFKMQFPSISVSTLVLKSLTCKRHVMYKCDCTHTHSNGSNQCWIHDRKFIDQVPTDLVIFILTTLTNPITKKPQKIQRELIIDSDELTLPIIKINHEHAEENKNNEDASSQYATATTENHIYKLNGTIQHEGVAGAGHYTNNIRNDKSQPETTWVSINNEKVTLHNDINKLSPHLIACWYRLQR